MMALSANVTAEATHPLPLLHISPHGVEVEELYCPLCPLLSRSCAGDIIITDSRGRTQRLKATP